MLLNYFIAVFFILVLLLISAAFFYRFFGGMEAIYMYLFNKPFFVHQYRKLEILSPSEIGFLKKHSDFYSKLNPKYQAYFQHRVHKFLQKYEFIPREEIVITQEMKVMVAATAVQLTFGFRTYLMSIFQYIVIYPDIYQSTITDNWHKGEFNPRMKAIVFSWKHFEEGFQSNSDNLNLGYHEFAHALNVHGLQSSDASAAHFAWLYKKMMEYLKNPLVQKRLIASEYFRIYAYSNQFEFFAVLIEHFFETPELFKREFPILFKKMQQMIYFNPRWFKTARLD